MLLHSLSRLDKINGGPYTKGSFENLKKLNVRSCGGLKNLLPLSTFKCLVQLQEIIVSHCETMEEIVVAKSKEENEETIMTTNLQEITLENLPLFRTFCSQVTQATDRASAAETLFSKKIQFPNLVEMTLSSINVERIWPDEMPPFNRLTVLTVKGCENLTYLMNLSTMRGLTHLKHVEICDCQSMEEVISAEEAGEEVILPNLDFLKLKDLPRLARLVMSNLIKCPSLAHVSVQNCPLLQSFPTVSESKARLNRQMQPG